MGPLLLHEEPGRQNVHAGSGRWPVCAGRWNGFRRDLIRIHPRRAAGSRQGPTGGHLGRHDHALFEFDGCQGERRRHVDRDATAGPGLGQRPQQRHRCTAVRDRSHRRDQQRLTTTDARRGQVDQERGAVGGDRPRDLRLWTGLAEPRSHAGHQDGGIFFEPNPPGQPRRRRLHEYGQRRLPPADADERPCGEHGSGPTVHQQDQIERLSRSCLDPPRDGLWQRRAGGICRVSSWLDGVPDADVAPNHRPDAARQCDGDRRRERRHEGERKPCGSICLRRGSAAELAGVGAWLRGRHRQRAVATAEDNRFPHAGGRAHRPRTDIEPAERHLPRHPAPGQPVSPRGLGKPADIE